MARDPARSCCDDGKRVTPPEPQVLIELRCETCDRLLCRYMPPIGYLSIRCSRCDRLHVRATAVA